METEEVKARARSAARHLAPAKEDAAEALRSDALRFFARIPEPPVYRRRDDPLRSGATELVKEGEGLLTRCYQLEEVEPLRPWRAAVEAHLDALCLVADGRVEAADEAWRRATDLERDATAPLRLWSRSDEAPVEVFDRGSGRSRYDPRPEGTVRAKLACPTCRKAGDFSFSPRHPTHRFTCAHCAASFTAYFAEVRTVEVQPLGRGRRYLFRVEELTGAQTRVAVDDASAGELQAARRDLLAFLYSPETVLRGVLNLNSSRVLWLRPGGPCFVATVAFGEGAAELDTLRALRDDVLLPRRPGRAFVRWYYREGPGWARWLEGRPLARAATRAMLRAVAALLTRCR